MVTECSCYHPQEQKTRGVITASAGNHGLALAYHGKQLNVPVTVVLPENSPKVKARIVDYILHCNYVHDLFVQISKDESALPY